MLSELQRWFAEARFGLFVHWGMYALYGRGEQVLFREHLDLEAYRARAHAFRPHAFDPEGWASMARDAGMRYAVLTAKHHDGYCLFETAESAFSSIETGPGRDLVAEYVRAFRRAGLRVGLYYSLADWMQPAYWRGPGDPAADFDAYVAYTHAQVRELCSNYGQIDLLWFDGPWPYDAEQWRAKELLETARHLQPGILINDRSGLPGDFDTPEREIRASQRPWEACMVSTERWWGYHAGDRRWRTPTEVIRMLAQVAEGGGNLLLNVGPHADGRMPARFLELLRDVGQWMARNGQAIYASERGILECSTLGRMSVVGSTVYLHLLYWQGETLTLRALENRVLRASYLADGWGIDFRQEGETLTLRGLPRYAPDDADTVIALQLEGTPRVTPWARERLWQGDARRMIDWAEGK